MLVNLQPRDDEEPKYYCVQLDEIGVVVSPFLCEHFEERHVDEGSASEPFENDNDGILHGRVDVSFLE